MGFERRLENAPPRDAKLRVDVDDRHPGFGRGAKIVVVSSDADYTIALNVVSSEILKCPIAT
jgi:hypothetical protein